MLQFNSQKESNKFVKKYEALINKITGQFYNKVVASWDDIYSMALEGFVLAMRKYDENRSNLTFVQYAAYSMRNHILTSLNEELRTVKLSSYAQDALSKKGIEHQFTSVSIESWTSDDDTTPGINQYKNNICSTPKWEDGDIYEYLYYRIEEKFKERDCEIFYMTFGLKGYEIYKACEVAKYFNITEGCVSQRLKLIINFIRKDTELCEMLALLCE